jgi:5-methylcytosine-specific restriction endonuclease McrA
MKPSRGTTIPAALRLAVHLRDNGCVGQRLGWEGPHTSRLELDHVRAGGMGMKSRTSEDNLVALCAVCHDWKTRNGRVARPELIAYLEAVTR